MDRKIAEVYSETGNTWGIEFDFRNNVYFITIVCGIIVSVFVGFFFLTEYPWWVQFVSNVFATVVSKGFITVFVAVVVAAVLTAIVLGTILRRRTLKENEYNHALHELAHYIRETTQVPEQTAEGVKSQEAFERLCREICEKVASVFQIQRDCEKVACCIRLTNPDEKSYKTVGRSSKLAGERSSYSKPVTVRSGVYKRITDDSFGNDNVLYIKDLKLAIKEDIISQDYNTRHFPDEIKSMMVARLNARIIDDETKEPTDALLGILYITSPKERGFSKLDVDRVKTVSDMIADAIWQIAMIRNAKNDKNGQIGEKSEQNNEQNISKQKQKRKSARRK